MTNPSGASGSSPGAGPLSGPASFTSASVAAALGAELRGPGDIPLRRLNTVHAAGPEDLTFIRSPKYAAMWQASRARAVLIAAKTELPPTDRNPAVLIVPDADLALIRAIPLFKPPELPPTLGVHPSAIVDPTAQIDPAASIGPMCIIGPGCVIGAHAILRPRVTLGIGVRVGQHTELEPGAVIHDHCVIGSRCTIHSNCVIGADGFGFRPSPDGRGVIKIPHAGNVEIGDHVELGACTCIDRGKFGPTIIGAGTKMDNHVQIAHNVIIGRSCLIAGCTGIAGSVVIEDGVMIGGHCGIADNLRIGKGARLAAFAAVMADVAPGQTVIGVPAVPHIQFFREKATMAKLVGAKRRRGTEP